MSMDYHDASSYDVFQITVDMKLTNSQVSFGNMTFKSYSPFSVFQY